MAWLVKCALGAACAFFLSAGAMAQEAWPARPIRMIVAYPAGGVIDLLTRVLSERLRDRLGQPVVVENRPGGNGVIGMQELVRSAPDGYSFTLGGLGGQVLPPLVNRNFPFDVVHDLTPVAKVAEFVNSLVVSNELPARNVQEFIALAKSRPGRMDFGSTGVGASNHLTAVLFMMTTGTRFEHVPYRGSAASLTDLRAGRIQMVFDNLPSALPAIQSGGVRILAVTSRNRIPQLPEVPTMIESGVPDFVVTSWASVFGPRGLPDAIRDRMAAALLAVVAEPETQARLRGMGLEPAGAGPAEFAAFFHAELARWKNVVDSNNIRVEE
ncbi:Bug family tripartite tricarboxylate transporter substrate binding protein [Pararoseomonas indoligenes]|uniref:Tripartite tricarboxylate transporter substrate binding protein n=1 Tax=Roseomonas indoligenes TaxID=2820811 RepID=A0A940N0J3_9PROT|nr:tripartite tricarboxylate transporter substrate binding protein [Pararoseomonas indoligenes]MBP0494552.1 tripartite tricarboxylate transporter substrate binding protein [Pararoseomonas indoligenes]